MSGIDNPIKKLKRLSVKDAEIARIAARQIKEDEQLRMTENRKKEHEKDVQLALSNLHADFVLKFERHKFNYAEGNIDDPIMRFSHNTRLDHGRMKAYQDACPMFLAELKDSFDLKVAEYACEHLSIEISVLDENKEESKMTENNQ
jgi:hypothetical protein